MPARSVAVRALFRRSPSTSTSTRVESRPRSLGRTCIGPLPTGVTPGAWRRASPTDSGDFPSSASRPIVSVRSGTALVSRSLRAAVTVTPTSRRPGTSENLTSAGGPSAPTVTARESREKPGDSMTTRYRSRLEAREAELAFQIGLRELLCSRGQVAQRHLRRRKDGTGGIRDEPDDVPGGRDPGRGEHQHDAQTQDN